MAGPIAVDTPDYQRGIVNPQLEVLNTQLFGGTANFFIPENAETLVAICSSIPPIETLKLTGVTTGNAYIGVPLAGYSGVNLRVFVFDAVPTLDTQLQVTGGSAGHAFNIQVYADAGVHLMVDGANARTSIGTQYVVPTVPSTLTLDHPPNELQYGSWQVSDGQALGPTPGTGQRLRIFSASVGHCSNAGDTVLADNTGTWFYQGHSVNPGQQSTYGPSGIALPALSQVIAHISGGTVVGTMTYTIETI